MRQIHIQLRLTEAEAAHLAATLEVGRDPETPDEATQLPFNLCDQIRSQIGSAPDQCNPVAVTFASDTIASEGEPGLKTTRLDAYSNLSTGHLSEVIRNALESTDSDLAWRKRLCVMSREYGWFVRIPDLEFTSAQEYGEIPACLRACLDVARADGASWVLFDVDEDPTPGLPYFDN